MTTDQQLAMQKEEFIGNWREHPAVNPKLEFPTVLVPIESLTLLIPKLQPFLAKNADVMKHIHPRIKMVKEFNDTHKMILLHNDNENNNNNDDDDDDDVLTKNLVAALQLDPKFLTKGPKLSMDISYSQLSYQYILSQLLTPLGISIPSAYEQIGHIAHFNFKPAHEPYGRLIGEVLTETNPKIETVVAKVGQVHGKYRTYEFDILAGPSKLETTVVEHGVQIQLHLGDCYWCSRLGGERQVLIQDILHPSTIPPAAANANAVTSASVNKEVVVADVFSGVGAVCLLLAKQAPAAGKNVTILANDWNPRAIEYFQKSIESNAGLNASRFELSSGDAYDFIMDLGAGGTGTGTGGGQRKKKQSFLAPDHVLMNFPLHGPTYLGALRWWSWKNIQKYYQKNNSYPRFHVYTFAKGTPTDDAEEEEVAVDIIANELLPVIGSGSGTSTSTSESSEEEDDHQEQEQAQHRREELDGEFGTQFTTRLVRDVAPGKVVVCVSFFLTPKLLRHMQGDFV
jgi:tRNA G37 N-methylase Trm5